MMRKAGMAVVLSVVVGMMVQVACPQVLIDPAAMADPNFKRAYELFLSTPEGRRIWWSVWFLSVTGPIRAALGFPGPGGQPVQLSFVPNGLLDPPPPEEGSYGAAIASFNPAGWLDAPISIKIRSVNFGTRFNLADTIHHELRHAEIFLTWGSEDPAKNPRWWHRALDAHDRLDTTPPADPANVRFRLELAGIYFRDLLQRIWRAILRVTTALFSFHPTWHLPFDRSGFGVASLLHEPLVTYERGGMVRPALAERWGVSDDGKVVTFFLRPGLRFHNGSLVSAYDVVYTYEQFILNPESTAPSWVRGPFIGVHGNVILKWVEALDEGTVRFTFSELPVCPFDYGPYARELADAYRFMRPIYGMSEVPILSKALGETFGPNSIEFLTCGLGPYRWQGWEPDSHVVLARFDHYQGPAFLVPEIVFLIIPEEIAQADLFLEGGIDYLPLLGRRLETWRWLAYAYAAGGEVIAASQLDGDGRGNVYQTVQPLLLVVPRLADAIDWTGIAKLIELGGDPSGYTVRWGDWREE